MLGFFLLSTIPSSVFAVIAIQFVNVMCVVFRNIIGEALLVEISQYQSISQMDPKRQQAEAQENVSLFFGSKSCGALIFSYLGGFSLEWLTKSQIFQICALFPLAVIIKTVFFYKEPAY